MITYQSNAQWPKGTISNANGDNVTTDSHDTKGKAEFVCDLLERKGLGGEGKIFPLRTWVSFEGSVEETDNKEKVDMSNDCENFDKTCGDCQERGGSGPIGCYLPTKLQVTKESNHVQAPPQVLPDQRVINFSKKLFEFRNQAQWVNKARSSFGNCEVPKGRYIAIDTKGRVCVSGREFMRAEKENTYPVTVYEI